MQIQFEAIQPDRGSSFRLLVSPRLNDFFYWHFHPELELVYIEGANGNRHVGNHISRFEGSDLVFIGSNIPHLNFDYGIKSDYEKIVLHIHPDFLKQAMQITPELLEIGALFDKARYGIAIGGATKARVGQRLKKLPFLPHFEQFIETLGILQELATCADTQVLHTKPFENQYNKREQERLQTVHRFIEAHFHRKIDIREVAQHCHLTEAAFCRYFKKMTRLTFTEFLNQYRINVAKRMLLRDQNVSESCYQCGFESLSYFNRVFKRLTNENPLSFKKRHMTPND